MAYLKILYISLIRRLEAISTKNDEFGSLMERRYDVETLPTLTLLPVPPGNDRIQGQIHG